MLRMACTIVTSPNFIAVTLLFATTLRPQRTVDRIEVVNGCKVIARWLQGVAKWLQSGHKVVTKWPAVVADLHAAILVARFAAIALKSSM